MSFWNIIIQWISHDDLTEKFFSLVSKAKLVKWQKSKTALCDLTKKLLPSNFDMTKTWQKSSNQSGDQTHGWILLKKIFYYIRIYSIFCRLSPFHCEWPQLVTILTCFDLCFVTKSKSLTF